MLSLPQCTPHLGAFGIKAMKSKCQQKFKQHFAGNFYDLPLNVNFLVCKSNAQNQTLHMVGLHLNSLIKFFDKNINS